MTLIEVFVERVEGGVKVTTSAGGVPSPPVKVAGSAFEDLQTQVQTHRALSDRPRHRPVCQAGLLDDIGRELFKAALSPLWARENGGIGGMIVVRSPDEALRSLPWDLMKPPPTDLVEPTGVLPLGSDPAWSVAVAPVAPRSNTALSGGPQRVLVLVASPVTEVRAGDVEILGRQELNYEEEEDAIATAAGVNDVRVRVSDFGTLEELKRLVSAFKPHVVHLSGHGTLVAGKGVFCFEDEHGGLAPVSGSMLAEAFRGQSSVRCVLVNACLTATAVEAAAEAEDKGQEVSETPTRIASSLCEALVAGGVPAAIGWGEKVADDRATAFAQAFYKYLSRENHLGRAMSAGRKALRDRADEGLGEGLVDLTYSLAKLYTGVTDVGKVYDSDNVENNVAEATIRRTLPNGMEGLIEGFVGRRRDLQRILPPLVSTGNDFRSVLVLTGVGGLGKSSLATKAATRLEGDGYNLVVVGPQGSIGGPMSGQLRAGERTARGDQALAESVARDILIELRQAAERHPEDDNAVRLAAVLSDQNKQTNDEKLGQVPAILARLRWVLILDNFEDALANVTSRSDREDDAVGQDSRPTVAHTGLGQFLQSCCQTLTDPRGGKLLITSRYLPAEIKETNQRVQHEALRDLTAAGFRKLLLQEKRLSDRFYRGDLSQKMISDLYRKFGGTPRFIKQVLHNMVAAKTDAELRTDLDGLTTDDEADDDQDMAVNRRTYLEDIAAPTLIGKLGVESQLAAGVVAAAYEAIPAEAVAVVLQKMDRPEVASATPGQVSQWLESAVAWGLAQPVATRWPVSQQTKMLAELPDDPAFIAGQLPPNTPPEKRDELIAIGIKRIRQARKSVALLSQPATRRYQSPGLLRGALADQIDLTGHRLRAAHAAIATWWKTIFADDREPEVGISISVGMDACRLHALAGEVWDLGCGMTVGLSNPLIERAAYGEARALLEAVPAAQRDGRVLHAIATIDLQQGEYVRARSGFEQSLEIMREIGDRQGEAVTLHGMASIDVQQGDYAGARSVFEQSLQIKREIGDRKGEAATLHQIATIDVHQGDYTRARSVFEESLQIRREIGDRRGEASTLHNIATIDLRKGEYVRARSVFEGSLQIAREAGDRKGEAETLHQIASIDLEQGEYKRARSVFEQSLQTKREIGDRQGEAATLHSIATIDLRQRDYTRARSVFEQSLQIMREIGDRKSESSTLHNIATIDLEQADYTRARTGFEKSLQIKREIGDRQGEAATLHQIATIDLEQADYTRARTGFEKSLQIRREFSDQYGIGAAFSQLAAVVDEMGRSLQASRLQGVCFLIDNSIGHGDTENDLKSYAALCSKAGLTESQALDQMKEIAEIYGHDGGDSIVAAAFDGLGD